ncbi:hypothetical protein LCGC14_2659580, partial [marine sediment metagenome]
MVGNERPTLQEFSRDDDGAVAVE